MSKEDLKTAELYYEELKQMYGFKSSEEVEMAWKLYPRKYHIINAYRMILLTHSPN